MHADGVNHDEPPLLDGTWFGNAAFRAELRELPPGAKLVAKILDRDAPLTAQQLVTHTLLPDRTVRYALSQLAEAELVTSQITLQDARKRLYTLSHPERR